MIRIQSKEILSLENSHQAKRRGSGEITAISGKMTKRRNDFHMDPEKPFGINSSKSFGI